MNVNEFGQQEKTEKNPRGAGRRPGSGNAELKCMRAGVAKYLKEKLERGETPSQYLLDYSLGDKLAPICSDAMQEAIEDLVTSSCAQ